VINIFHVWGDIFIVNKKSPSNTLLGRMKKNIRYIFTGAFIGITLITRLAHAACLDPNTLKSGYKLSLNDEIVSSEAIIIGEILKEEHLFEDLSDAEGITTSIYTVQVKRQLKGQVSSAINIRVENDSGRYPMAVGEEHLLFLTRQGENYVVNSCGNSSRLPGGNEMLEQIERQVVRGAKAP
jgi:hypothetical protein